jgi:hypothetical protein
MALISEVTRVDYLNSPANAARLGVPGYVIANLKVFGHCVVPRIFD